MLSNLSKLIYFNRKGGYFIFLFFNALVIYLLKCLSHVSLLMILHIYFFHIYLPKMYT